MLVAYSSDEEEDENNSAQPPAKKPRITGAQNDTVTRGLNDLPPLPNDFHDLYATSVRSSTSDDPSLHGGRKRTTPHVVGNWPSHVYLEWFPSPEQVEVLNAVLDAVHKRSPRSRATTLALRSLITSDLAAALPLHISLSASLSLTTDNKDMFLDRLTASLKSMRGLRQFEVKLTDLLWAPNYDRTRWFLVVGIERPAQDELNLLLKCCNHVCKQSGLPTLYMASSERDRSGREGAAATPMRQRKIDSPGLSPDDYSDMFHFSLGWSLEKPSKEMIDFGGVEEKVSEDLRDIRAQFDSVKVKIGNTITSVPLGRTQNPDKSVLI